MWWAWWLALPALALFIGWDYLEFLRQKRRHTAAIAELEAHGFLELYPPSNVHDCHKMGETAAQEAVAAKSGADVADLTYGELDLPSLAKLLFALEDSEAIKLPRRPRLIDLGSGNGRAVLALAMMRPWARCAGVELFPPLHASALRALARYHADVRPRLPKERAACEVQLRCADMLKTDLRKEDVVFALSTAFSEATMSKLFDSASDQMRPGSVLVVADQPKYPPRFRCVSEIHYRAEKGAEGDASWGTGTLGILVRK